MQNNFLRSLTLNLMKEENIHQNSLLGYPLYPEKDDIYNKYHKKRDINPEEPSKIKPPNEPNDTNNEKDFTDDVSGGDLDLEGFELEDVRENVGSEDEENAYYSLGGDDHIELEED